jgi:pantoate--beta-alanine ligase
MQQISSKLKTEKKAIGFVPTMGYLHAGHSSLIKKSKETTDITVASIFINPTQFSPNEDLASYPRDLERDKKLLINEGVDFLFYPSADEIYPKNFQTFVELEKLTKILEGEIRPIHFRGVTTVVSILFNCVKPDYAIFGQKDAQQLAVIKRMVEDLKIDIEIISCPIVRETDGLAMSSRNIYLTPSERDKALLISKSLFQAEEMIKSGEYEVKKILKKINQNFLSEKNVHLNYLKIVEAENFLEIEYLQKNNEYYVLAAAKVGKTRLIDNVKIKL